MSFSCFDGIRTSLGSTDGTCTVANSYSSPVLSFCKRAAILSDLFLIRGNGRDESTAIGVRTG